MFQGLCLFKGPGGTFIQDSRVKMMVKSEWCRISYFEIQQAPSELLLPSTKNLPGKSDLYWQDSRRGLLSFKIKNLDHFSP
jgi:hypothetical protein